MVKWTIQFQKNVVLCRLRTNLVRGLRLSLFWVVRDLVWSLGNKTKCDAGGPDNFFMSIQFRYWRDWIEVFKKTKPGLHFPLLWTFYIPHQPCSCNLLQLFTASSIVLTSVVVPLLIFISANFVYTKN